VTNVDTCAVCGRTILKGERTRAYLTAEGERRSVCELCRERAETAGWVWEEAAGERTLEPQRQRRRRTPLTALLRGRFERQQGANGEASAPSDAEGDAEDGTPPRRSPDPAAPGAGVGRSGVPEAPMSRLERAVARFNRSDHARTVAGLTRTLGPPSVSIGTAAGSPGEVRITVAWELSWYQWGVDLREEDRPVHDINKGHEVNELDGPAREWNAHADEDGSLRLGAAPLAKGEPAGAES
jgi:hypothetical protein